MPVLGHRKRRPDAGVIARVGVRCGGGDQHLVVVHIVLVKLGIRVVRPKRQGPAPGGGDDHVRDHQPAVISIQGISGQMHQGERTRIGMIVGGVGAPTGANPALLVYQPFIGREGSPFKILEIGKSGYGPAKLCLGLQTRQQRAHDK